jgi:hypothetical protein
VIPGWWEGSAGITAPVNLAAWETPPALCKTAFEMAANEQILLMLARYDARSWMRCAGWSPAAASSALSPPGAGGGPQASFETSEEIAARRGFPDALWPLEALPGKLQSLVPRGRVQS